MTPKDKILTPMTTMPKVNERRPRRIQGDAVSLPVIVATVTVLAVKVDSVVRAGDIAAKAGGVDHRRNENAKGTTQRMKRRQTSHKSEKVAVVKVQARGEVIIV